MFQQTDVSRRECRCGETNRLPKRKIPGHDGKHRAERIISDSTALDSGIDLFRLEQDFSSFRVIAKCSRAFSYRPLLL